MVLEEGHYKREKETRLTSVHHKIRIEERRPDDGRLATTWADFLLGGRVHYALWGVSMTVPVLVLGKIAVAFF